MKSDYIKACLSSYYRFPRQCHYLATEVGKYSSDFLVVDQKDVCTEVEIKVSKSDLTADFRKDKHRIYEAGNSIWTPNYFYFAVPKELLEHAVAKCADKKYGIILIYPEAGAVKRRGWNTWGKTSDEAVEKHIKKINEYFDDVRNIEVQTNKIMFDHTVYVPYEKRIKVVKRAKKLHDRPANQRIKHQIVARLSSEMAGLRQTNEKINEGKKDESDSK